MRRWLPLVLLLLLVATSATAVFLFRENRDLRRQLAQLTKPAPAPAAAAAPMPAVATSPADPTDGTAELRPAVASTSEGGRADRGRGRDGGMRAGRGMEAITRILNDPQAREAMVGRMKSQIQRTYAGLFARLGLDEVQAETLSALLAERELARREMGFLERAASTDEERAQLRAAREGKMQSIEAGVASILGADGMQILRDYQQSAPQRAVAEDVSRRASFSGAALSAQQTDQLAQVLRTVQNEMPAENPGFQPGWFRENSTPPPPLTQSAIDTYLAARQAQNREALTRAQGILSTAQIEALVDQQIEELGQVQAQLEFQLRNPDLVGGLGMGMGPPGGPGEGFFGGGPGGGTGGGAPRPGGGRGGGG
jgi:hypothetical protein